MTWHLSPEPAALLADCAARPPLRDNRTGSFNRPTPLFRRSDERVKQLERLWKRAFDEAFDRGDMEAAKAVYDADPDTLIAQAIEQRKDMAA